MKFENHQHYNCEITTDCDEKFLIHANWMHNHGLDHWKGWECDAGFKRLDIDKDFNVYSAQCKNEFLGNLFAEWNPRTTASTCFRERCTGCTDDLLTEKRSLTQK